MIATARPSHDDRDLPVAALLPSRAAHAGERPVPSSLPVTDQAPADRQGGEDRKLRSVAAVRMLTPAASVVQARTSIEYGVTVTPHRIRPVYSIWWSYPE